MMGNLSVWFFVRIICTHNLEIRFHSLHIAAQCGQIAVVEYLVFVVGVDFNVLDLYGLALYIFSCLLIVQRTKLLF